MPKDKLKIAHKPLHCPVCGARFMNVFGQPLPNHAQIRTTTTKGDTMDIGICQNCIEKGVSLEMLNAVLEGIKDYWCFEIDVNKNIKSDEKKRKKAFHNSHTISDFTKIIHTGKRAEKEARKMGKLL